MLEIKLTIESPDLTKAIIHLADAISCRSFEKRLDAPKCVPTSEPETTSVLATSVPSVPESKPVPAVSIPATAPTQKPEPVPQATVPVKKYTFNQISKAGAKLCADTAKMDQLVSLLNSKYGVPAITMIDESKYPDLVADLTALGAVIEEE